MKTALRIVLLLLGAGTAQADISFVAGSVTPAASFSVGTTLTINRPAAVVIGDFMLVQLVLRDASSSTTISPPSGWTLVNRFNQGSTILQAIYSRRAGGSEPGSYTFTYSPGDPGAITLVAFRGVDTVLPIPVSAAQGVAGSSSIVAPSVDTLGPDREIVRFYATANGNSTITLPAGLTALTATQATGNGSNGMALRSGSVRQPSIGPSGTATATTGSAVAGIGTTVSLRPDDRVVAEYRMDESSWNGTAGEVADAIGSYAGRARNGAGTAGTTPAIAGSPGTCRYGSFNGSTQYVELPSTLPRAGQEFTLTAWIRTTHDWSSQKYMRIWADDQNNNGYFISLGDAGARRLRFQARSPTQTILDSTAVVQANQWYFIAAVMDTLIANTMTLYIYDQAGTLVFQGSTPRTDFSPGNGLVAIGGEVDGSSEGSAPYRFAGNIDEVRLRSVALSVDDLPAVLAATRPCAAGTAALRITHSATGLFCLDHTVTLTATDGSGNPALGYSGTVNLTTSTARGSWVLAAGTGALNDPTADDGAASYAWNPAESSATLLLRYRTGTASVVVDATDSLNPGITDDGSQGSIAFAPSGFTVTSAAFGPAVPAAIPAFASPQVAGTAFNVHVTAFGQTPTDPTCGIIEGYTGTKPLQFWSSYLNPSTGTRQVLVNGTAAATTEGASAAQNVVFSNGQAVVSAQYRDAGALSLSMKDTSTGNPGLPSGIRGSTGSFVSRPANFTVSNVRRTSDAFANPAASTANGTVFIGAGRPFTATVTAVDVDGNTTPNFGRETAAESVGFQTSLVLPATGNAPAVSGTAGVFTNGVATGTSFAWAEVGIMRLVPQVADGDYLGAGAATGTASGNVGRFIPDSFGIALNTPVFGTACTAGSFTYIGQPFTYTVAPVITATARAFGGTTTQNYTGSLFRLTNASLTGRSYAAGSGTLDTTGLPATTADPAIVDAGGGVATLTFSAGSGLAFTRGVPVVPFDASVTLSQNVIDLDSVAATNPVTFGTGPGILFSTGATQRYGRLALRNAVGSELLDLPMNFIAQFYASVSAGFTAHTADSCSVAPAISFSGYQGSLTTGETCVRDTGSPGVSAAGCPAPAPVGSRYRATHTAGSFNLILAAPGSGNSGAVVVTGAAPAWLRFDWNTAIPGNENPSGLATFGLFPGPSSRIYQREVY